MAPTRHSDSRLALSPDSTSVYVTDEFASALVRFSRESGSPVEPDPPGGDPTTPLVLSLDAKAKQKAKKLNATATCSIDCTLTLSARGKAGGDKFLIGDTVNKLVGLDNLSVIGGADVGDELTLNDQAEAQAQLQAQDPQRDRGGPRQDDLHGHGNGCERSSDGHREREGQAQVS